MPQQNQLNILKTEVKYLEIELTLKMKLLEEKKKEIVRLQKQAGFSDEVIFEGLNGRLPTKGH